MVLVVTSLVDDIVTGFCCWAAVNKYILIYYVYSTGDKEQSFELNANNIHMWYILTESACILELYLQHFHGGGDNDLAHTCTTTCQHLFEHSQALSVDRQEKNVSQLQLMADT